ncbi:35052_t:CDS:2, partial [Gigaspora margarita]
MVCGEHRTKKTILARIASREAGKIRIMGIIYVDILPDYKDLGEAFKKTIDFTFEENKSEVSEWKRALRAFNHASVTYKQ